MKLDRRRSSQLKHKEIHEPFYIHVFTFLQTVLNGSVQVVTLQGCGYENIQIQTIPMRLLKYMKIHQVKKYITIE